jgi:hypothetical protein
MAGVRREDTGQRSIGTSVQCRLGGGRLCVRWVAASPPVGGAYGRYFSTDVAAWRVSASEVHIYELLWFSTGMSLGWLPTVGTTMRLLMVGTSHGGQDANVRTEGCCNDGALGVEVECCAVGSGVVHRA